MAQESGFCFEVPVFVARADPDSGDEHMVMVQFHGVDADGYAVWSVSAVFVLNRQKDGADYAKKTRAEVGVQETDWRNGHCLKTLISMQLNQAGNRGLMPAGGFRSFLRPERLVAIAVESLACYLSSLPKMEKAEALVGAST